MQKVIVVSKTHLDLGFTDYAEHIYHKYLDEFIPNAVSIANELNADGSKRFVWTTGSWLLKEALKNGKRAKPASPSARPAQRQYCTACHAIYNAHRTA